MSFLSDAWGSIKSVAGGVVDVAGGAVDVAGDVFTSLPGGVQVSGALRDLVNGPLRDFAKTPVGMTVLRSIATAVYGPLANSLVYWGVPFGAQMATIAWAVPGLVRGERFDEAWMLEFRWRAEKTAEIVGPGILDSFGAQLRQALDQLASFYGVGELVDITAEQLASKLGIRVDVAAYVISLWNRTAPPPREVFDLRTGRRLKTVERRTTYADSRFGTRSEAFASPASSTSSTATHTLGRRPSAAATPISSTGASSSSSRSSSTTRSDLALAATIVLAAGALVWWHIEESRRDDDLE